ncbi:VOC family protein [Methylomonas sp. MED-D]|uniref:Glyoxalase n=1 Tax=Methylomonas koyamae TaxID=702114 RepID=A0A177NAQ9_9GAMM|nr:MULTISPECIES: VOC family protein [Methylomonas]MDT4332090.1 VOC family protein [Methylomonas sp. MV1]OAI15077.1 glyoxalase [Methylomonas koyamae]OHX35569.1 glyoxalase [Methylomonas sp. LWB]
MNNNLATWFELPAADLGRAQDFYRHVLNSTFKLEEMNDMNLAIFEAEEGAVSGMLVQGECYQPSETGAVVYFNGGADLNEPLAKVEAGGGRVLVPKTPIHDGDCGYFALFIDSEGNRVGLYSPA